MSTIWKASVAEKTLPGLAKRRIPPIPVAKRSPDPQLPPASAIQPGRPLQLPKESIKKAESIFKNFKLSKFTKDSRPSNYVPMDKKEGGVHWAPSTQDVYNFQRKQFERHLHKLTKLANTNPGMTIALPPKTLKGLKSYNEKKGTVDLDDVLKLMSRHMRGTAFLVKGHPVLNRLALTARTRELVPANKPGGKK
jgi:hypothetical protein